MIRRHLSTDIIWPCVTVAALFWTTDASAQFRGPFPPYGYPGGRYALDSAARFEVTPREAEVYIDGYFAGVVDDFDGVFQRLHVPAGEREVMLYLEGYRPFRQKVLFTPGRTLKIRHTMEKLGPGEAAEPRPQRAEGDRGRGPGPGARAPVRAAFGTLMLRIQPADASVLIDGQPWQNPENEDRLAIELGEGSHRIEIRKDGYRTYTTTVRVRRGETVPLNVRLPPAR